MRLGLDQELALLQLLPIVCHHLQRGASRRITSKVLAKWLKLGPVVCTNDPKGTLTFASSLLCSQQLVEGETLTLRLRHGMLLKAQKPSPSNKHKHVPSVQAEPAHAAPVRPVLVSTIARTIISRHDTF
jgi:hypothetical protein